MKKPNFFIIGAPKCGTTALAKYLESHPDVFFSIRKEPHYFNNDDTWNHPWNISYNSDEEYLSVCFKGSQGYKAVGEGSTGYLYSEVAVPSILKFNPDSKFIVMVRNHVDMVQSWHSQLIKSGYENCKNFQCAWNLQEKRKKGKKIPYGAKHKTRQLQYGTYCKIGEQVERLYSFVPKDKILLIFFEDFKKNPDEVYQRVLNFLSLEDDGREIFPVYNKRKKILLPRVNSFVNTLERKISRLPIKKVFKIKKKFGIFNFIKEKFIYLSDMFHRKKGVYEELSDDFKIELIEYFKEDRMKLSKIAEKNLSHWEKI
jgi:hypothetical protein